MKIKETNGQNDVKNGMDVSGIFFTWSLPIIIWQCWLYMGPIAINNKWKKSCTKRRVTIIKKLWFANEHLNILLFETNNSMHIAMW